MNKVEDFIGVDLNGESKSNIARFRGGVPVIFRTLGGVPEMGRGVFVASLQSSSIQVSFCFVPSSGLITDDRVPLLTSFFNESATFGSNLRCVLLVAVAAAIASLAAFTASFIVPVEAGGIAAAIIG